MGTSLDIKIKRANKVYHAGVRPRQVAPAESLHVRLGALTARPRGLPARLGPRARSSGRREPLGLPRHGSRCAGVRRALPGLLLCSEGGWRPWGAAEDSDETLGEEQEYGVPPPNHCQRQWSHTLVWTRAQSCRACGVPGGPETAPVAGPSRFLSQPIQIINSTIEMVKPGKFPSGKTEIPFEFPLHVKGNKVLYETYHGVFVNIQYTVRCDVRRSLLAKDLTKTCEFIVHSAPQKGKLTPSPVDFTITPETLQNVKERALLPKFLIRGHLNSTNCVITQPLTGELVVESSEAAIRSIELQLVRVETCGCAEGYARDATEIQNIQIADGDVCRGLSIPIYMVFPRLFTCPTLETTNFKVGFTGQGGPPCVDA
ncbi:PREDICTED: Down syndrome critical region protein 3 [Condylura cristata]|uniref:Down syndrome critical region protein 3 n=1 Tax=Condylura cristata TaxID=143302 RepID=UPI00064365E2|nr:PREDICTED: Down syndrome critical region protein 3 [Condylura cristata]